MSRISIYRSSKLDQYIYIGGSVYINERMDNCTNKYVRYDFDTQEVVEVRRTPGMVFVGDAYGTEYYKMFIRTLNLTWDLHPKVGTGGKRHPIDYSKLVDPRNNNPVLKIQRHKRSGHYYILAQVWNPQYRLYEYPKFVALNKDEALTYIAHMSPDIEGIVRTWKDVSLW